MIPHLTAPLAGPLQELEARILEDRYLEYRIRDTPCVMVVADAGTRGMGTMAARDAAEMRGRNRGQRNGMALVKEGIQVTEMIARLALAAAAIGLERTALAE